MAKEEKVVEAVETAANAEAPVAETVPLEQYNRLYEQATDLDRRYRRLSELYNALLEQYLRLK